MLGKLFKHEFKDTYLIFAVCLIVMVATTLAGAIMFSLGAWDRAFESDNAYATSMVLSYIMLAFFVFAGSSLIAQYYFVWRYHKNLFTDQGYLMHTLPVKSSDLIGSKLFVAVIWQYVIYITGFLCLMALVASMAVGVGEDIGFTMRDIGQEIGNVFNDPDFGSGVPFMICMFLLLLVYPFLRTLYMYVCVGIGQMAKKNKFVIAIGLVFGIRFALRIIGQFFRIIFMFSVAEFMDDINAVGITMMGMGALIFAIGVAVGFYFLAKYFIDKKLNLE